MFQTGCPIMNTLLVNELGVSLKGHTYSSCSASAG